MPVKLEGQQFVIENTETERLSLNLLNYFLEQEDYTLFNFQDKILENFNHGVFDIIIIYSQPLLNDVHLETLFERMTALKKKLRTAFFSIRPKILVISTQNEMKLDKVEAPKGMTLISARHHDELVTNDLLKDVFPGITSAYLHKTLLELTTSINQLSVSYAAKLTKIFNKKRFVVSIGLLSLLVSVFLITQFLYDRLPEYILLNLDTFSVDTIYTLVSTSLYEPSPFGIIISAIILLNFGVLTERIYGSLRYLFILLVTIVATNTVLFAFMQPINTEYMSVGITPVIYGLIGAYLYTFLVFRRFLAYTIRRTMIFIVLAVFFIIVLADFTYFMAMLTGLFSGLIAAFIVGIPGARNSSFKNRIMTLILLIVYVALGILIGMK